MILYLKRSRIFTCWTITGMNKSLQAKLDQLLDRHEELSALLSDSQIISDQEKFRLYSKEYSDIEPVVNCFRQLQDKNKQLEGARDLVRDPDPDIRQMAETEVADLS